MGLDAVEIVMAWEESFGIAIADPETAAIRTPRMAIEVIWSKLGGEEPPGFGGCLSQRAFYRLRRAFVTVAGCSRGATKPCVRVADVTATRFRRSTWKTLSANAGVSWLPGVLFGFGFPAGQRTFADLVRYLVAYHPRSLMERGERWTRRQVREVVRAVVAEQLGIYDFADDADFVYDLRID